MAFVREPCRACEGTGRLGILAGYRLLCETCRGTGHVFRARMSVLAGRPV